MKKKHGFRVFFTYLLSMISDQKKLAGAMNRASSETELDGLVCGGEQNGH